MVYANLIIHVLSINFNQRAYVAHLGGRYEAMDPVYALFDGGHPLLESGMINILPLLIISIVAAFSYLLNNYRSKLRFIPIVLLPLCFYSLVKLPISSYTVYNIGTVLLLLAPLTYIVVKISQRKFSFGLKTLRGSIKGYAIVAFAPLMVLIFDGFALLSSIYYFNYVVIFVGCALGLLRSARATGKMLSEPKFVAITLAPVMVAMLLLLVSQQIAQVIWRVIQFVSLSIVVPVILFVANAIGWFFSLFYTHDPTTAPLLDGGGLQQELEFLYQYTQTHTEGTHIYIVAGILIIILAIAVYKVIRVIFRGKQIRTKRGVTEERSHIVSLPEKMLVENHTEHKSGLFVPKDSRMAVRYYYRRFLKICAEKGVPHEVGDTSEDVNSKNKSKFPAESMARLRVLYIKARYSEHDIEKSESKEAKELIKKQFEIT